MALYIDKNKVKELLGSGLSQAQVASVLGCEQPYIAEILADEEFAAEVANLKIANFTAETQRDRNIDAIEDNLISKLGETIENGGFYKPKDLLMAFQVLNKASRRGAKNTVAAPTVTNNIVHLNIPTAALQPKLVVSQNNEVIGIGEQTMVTMPAATLLQKLAKEKASGDKNAKKYSDTLKYLPSRYDGTSGP